MQNQEIMKSIKKPFFTLILSCLFLFGFTSQTRAQCSANFTYNIGANGLVNLYSTANFTAIANMSFYWYSNGVLTYTGAAWSGTSTSISYTANGTYTVTLHVFGTAPSCSNTANAVITVTNATGCLLNASYLVNNLGGGNVNFTSNSTNTLVSSTYTWSFGDGSTGSGANPSHTYTNNGIYTVSLTVSNSATCTSSSIGTISVCLSPVTAGFNYSVGLNGQVTFTSTSTPSGSNVVYNWTFHNQIPGSYSATGVPTATFTYPANGFYTVSLSSGVLGCSSSTSQVFIINNICNLNAMISYSNVSANGQVNFIGGSSGTNSTTTYVWGFGDGNTGSGQTPVHTYTSPGVYNVTLTITNTGTCNATSTTTTNVQVCMMGAGFTWVPGNNGLVTFYSTSTGTNAGTSYTWTINNWQNNISGVNMPTVSQTYSANGNYTVLLTIQNGPGCTFYSQQMVSINNVSCTANPNFSLAQTATAQVWNAIPAFPSNITNAVWSWGDGSSSNGLFVSHTYSASGMYNICLSVTVNCSSTASACSSYSIFRSGNSMIQVNVVDPALVSGFNESTASLNAAKLFPNPSHNGVFTLQLEDHNIGAVSVVVMTINGAELYRSEISETQKTNPLQLNLQDLPHGIYLLRLEQGQESLNKKLIITKD